jgi:hypothetical protein
VSLRHLENLLETTMEELNFALWYLKQRSLVAADDKSSLQITVDGMDYLASSSPSADLVMPFIRTAPTAVIEEPAPKPPEIPRPSVPIPAAAAQNAPHGAAAQQESARSVLDRVLARR